MNFKVNKLPTKSFSIDVKRFYVPFEIQWTCPECKNNDSYDLSAHYLSFPDVGKPMEYNLYCHECDHEETIEIQLDLDLKVVEGKKE